MPITVWREQLVSTILVTPCKCCTGQMDVIKKYVLERIVSELLSQQRLPSWLGLRIHPLHLCGEVRLPTLNECPGYDTKQSDGEVSVMLELWGMWCIPSLPLLPGPLWPGEVASDRVLSIGQIELICVLILNWIAWNWTVLRFKLYT